MTLEELKEIMYTDPQRYQAIMRSAQAGGALSGGTFQGRTDRVYDPDVFDDGDNYQYGSYLTPKMASEQMSGYKPTNNGRGPAAMDFNNYDNHPEQEPLSEEEWNAPTEEEIAKTKRIETIKSMIADAEKRIAENTAALRNGDYEDVNKQLGQLEMDKIGFRFNGQSKNNDPTSFWRWNQARVDTKEANDLRKTEAKNKFGNEISKWENRQFDPNMTAMEVRQEIKNIENAIQEGKNIGADVSRLDTIRQSLLDRISGKGTTAVEDWNGKFDTFMTGVNNGVYTKEEIDNYAKEHEDEMSVAQYNKLLDASLKTGKKEDDKAKAKLEKDAKALFQKERPSEEWEDVSDATKKKYRDRVRGK